MIAFRLLVQVVVEMASFVACEDSVDVGIHRHGISLGTAVNSQRQRYSTKLSCKGQSHGGWAVISYDVPPCEIRKVRVSIVLASVVVSESALFARPWSILLSLRALAVITREQIKLQNGKVAIDKHTSLLFRGPQIKSNYEKATSGFVGTQMSGEGRTSRGRLVVVRLHSCCFSSFFFNC